MRSLVVVLLALLAASLGCSDGPPLAVAPNVDLSIFQGKWYEIARLPRTTQTNCNGTTAFYTLGTDGSLQLVNQCNIGTPTGPLSTITMTATAPDRAAPAKLLLEVSGFSGDYWILEVGPNYEYAVVGHPSRLYLWILSRMPTLDMATMTGILDRAQANQFDTSRIEYTPQPPGGERISSDVPIGGPTPPAPWTGCSMAKVPGRDGGLLASLGFVVVGLAVLGRRSRAWLQSDRAAAEESSQGRHPTSPRCRRQGCSSAVA